MSFPTKAERTTCYAGRDRYWECLDAHKISVDQTQSSPCESLRKIYEAGCPAQWVKHFDRKHGYLKFKHRIETEGYEPLDSNLKN